MTFDEALKIFGLDARPDPDQLNALYKAMQKIAFIKGNEREAKKLNVARAARSRTAAMSACI